MVVVSVVVTLPPVCMYNACISLSLFLYLLHTSSVHQIVQTSVCVQLSIIAYLKRTASITHTYTHITKYTETHSPNTRLPPIYKHPCMHAHTLKSTHTHTHTQHLRPSPRAQAAPNPPGSGAEGAQKRLEGPDREVCRYSGHPDTPGV